MVYIEIDGTIGKMENEKKNGQQMGEQSEMEQNKMGQWEGQIEREKVKRMK